MKEQKRMVRPRAASWESGLGEETEEAGRPFPLPPLERGGAGAAAGPAPVHAAQRGTAGALPGVARRSGSPGLTGPQQTAGAAATLSRRGPGQGGDSAPCPAALRRPQPHASLPYTLPASVSPGAGGRSAVPGLRQRGQRAATGTGGRQAADRVPRAQTGAAGGRSAAAGETLTRQLPAMLISTAGPHLPLDRLRGTRTHSVSLDSQFPPPDPASTSFLGPTQGVLPRG